MRKFSKLEKEISEELKENGYHEMMTASEVARAIGAVHPKVGREFMEGCPTYKILKREKYRRSDVVIRIAQSRMEAFRCIFV